MSVTPLDIGLLIEWLGAEGAVFGLEKGRHTNSELMMIARENGVLVDSKTPRRQIAIEIVMSGLQRVDKSTDQLIQMSKEELVRYFNDRMVSKSEMVKLLESLGLAPRGKVRGKLVDFVASEVSDLGMYERVAKGQHRV